MAPLKSSKSMAKYYFEENRNGEELRFLSFYLTAMIRYNIPTRM
jgi:hypothetical protein